jgi:lysophospholipase L1-like esterase
MSFNSVRGLALALGVVGVASSCTVPFTDLVAPVAQRGDMFNSYVAIGNSITAGYQSGGLTDSTQKRSYAFLLAQSMGTRFAYPSMNNPGCPSLINNFQTQTRVLGTGTTCFLRSTASAADVLNNVAVPGAWSGDPTSSSTTTSNALTTFFLGGKTQVQKALDANPTFVSVWIGNNDLLGPSISSGGTSTGPAPSLAGITSGAQFQTNYDAILTPLVAANPNLKGVLIGVVNVTNAPIMFAAAALTVPAFKAGFDAIACGAATSGCFVSTTTTVDASCGSNPTALINTFLAFQIRLGAHPSTIACIPTGSSGLLPFPIGDAFILDPTEQTTINTAVTTYNTYISNKATALGFAYYDPNTQLVALRAVGTVVRTVPTLGATGTFGTGMSLDGVHPGAAVHLLIANDMIAAINAKYGSKLPLAF